MRTNISANTSRHSFLYTLTLGLVLIGLPQMSAALTFTMPHNGNIIGRVQYSTVEPGETLSDAGRRFDLGGYEMIEANRGVNFSNPEAGTRLVIPSQFILPDAPRKGIVINLAELRLYYYHPDGVTVSTFPVGVGQDGWNTPLGKTQIVRMRKDPTWVVPDSIYENRMEGGDPTPKVVPPGPTNPLGQYAMSLGFTNIVIHGTPYPRAVGLRSSHGCIRMMNSDVEQIFKQVKVGTPVYIVHQAVKIGRVGNELYLEAHEPISEEMQQSTRQDVPALIRKAAGDTKQVSVEWNSLDNLESSADGYPQPIGQIH